MKKTFCVLLAFLMLLPFCPVNSAVASLSDASLAFDGGGLVTLGRPYTVSLGQAAYCSGNGDDLGIKLTDYRFAGAISPQPEEEWVGFDAAGAVFTVEIVIELASAATGLFSFCADFAAYSTNGIYLPSKVEFLGSTDGAGYTLLGEGKLDTLDNGTVSRCSYTTTEHVSLRYLKTRITGSGKVFVDEIFAVRHGLLSQTGSLVYDTQGLVYELRGDSAAVVGYDPSVTLGGDAVTPVIPTPADGLTDGVTYTIGRGSEAQTEVIAQFLDPARPNHPNMSTPDKKYIVIHNTGNYSDGADASANHRYMLFNTDCEASWHYTVDKDVIYQALSDYTTGYHSSDGAYGAGNYYGIGVEICVNGFPGTYSGDAYEAWLEDSFLPAVRRAAMLTAELCVRHGLDPATAIRQHYDSNGKNCPMQMRYTSSLGGYTRDDGDVWKQFIGWVNDDYRALTGGTAAAYESVGRLTVPDSITVSGRDYPVTAVEEDAFAAAPESVFLGANVQNLPSAVRGVTTISPQNSHISAVMPAALPDSGVVIADGLVKGLYTGTTAGALLSKLEDGPTLYDASGEPKADADAVATGDYFKSPNGRLYVVVTGDLNGDGRITASDYLLLKRYVLRMSALSAHQIEAGKVGGGDRLGASDYLLLKRAVLYGGNFAPEEETRTVTNYAYMKGVWVSQYDLAPLLCESGSQRAENELRTLAGRLFDNIKKDGYNTVFMQVRPFGDSFAPSRYYPASSFVTGAYGRAFDYDPVAVLVDEAHARGLSIHAWINPYRLMKPDELRAVSTDYLLRRWLDEDRLREVDGRLYLDPSDAGARSLIINGAKELLHDYNFDGLHIDDYFYPTQSEDFDRVAFLNSGETDLAAFRESNINKLVSGLYAAVKSVDSRLLFGVSPAGNLSNLKSGYYLDVETWCSQEGYLDYILPQVYFGFLHETCAFDELTVRWADVAASGSVRLYIGLTGGKAVDGRAGVEDRYAGTEAGRREWIEHTDVLKRSLECLFDTDGVDGFCFFSYQYLYDPLTGKANEALAEEYAGFAPLIRNK